MNKRVKAVGWRRKIAKAIALLAFITAPSTAAAQEDEQPIGRHDPERDTFMDPHAGRGRAKGGAREPVEWWEDRPWRWEIGAGGGAQWFGRSRGPLALHASASGRIGVRYQRRPSSWEAGFGHAIVSGLRDGFLGNQYGADVRARWFSNDAWAIGLKPTAAILFPEADSKHVAARVTSMLGLIVPEIGIARIAPDDVRPRLAFDAAFGLLLWRHVGLELSGGWGVLTGTKPAAIDVGLTLAAFAR